MQKKSSGQLIPPAIHSHRRATPTAALRAPMRARTRWPATPVTHHFSSPTRGLTPASCSPSRTQQSTTCLQKPALSCLCPGGYDQVPAVPLPLHRWPIPSVSLHLRKACCFEAQSTTRNPPSSQSYNLLQLAEAFFCPGQLGCFL